MDKKGKENRVKVWVVNGLKKYAYSFDRDEEEGEFAPKDKPNLLQKEAIELFQNRALWHHFWVP